MSEKLTRDRHSRQFKKEFLIRYQKEGGDKTFYEFCEDNNIKPHTAKAWPSQLRKKPTKNFVQDDLFFKGLSGGDDDENVGSDEDEEDQEVDVESPKIRKTKRSTYSNSKPEDKSIESDDLSTQSSTVLGTFSSVVRKIEEKKMAHKRDGFHDDEEEVNNEVNNKPDNNQIQLYAKNQEGTQKMWVFSLYLLDICAKYTTKDSNVKFILNANGVIVAFAFVNVTIWFVVVFLMLVKM